MGRDWGFFKIRTIVTLVVVFLCVVGIFHGASSIRSVNVLNVANDASFYGRVKLLGSSESWMDENASTTSLRTGPSIPDVENMCGTGFYMPTFDGINTVEQVYGCFEVPHDEKKPDSSYYTDTCYFHIHAAPSTNDTGHITFHLWYMIANDDSTMSAHRDSSNATGVAVGACKSFTLTFTGIPVRRLGTRIVFMLFRDPATETDTYEHDCFTGLAGIHYRVRSFGSQGMMN